MRRSRRVDDGHEKFSVDFACTFNFDDAVMSARTRISFQVARRRSTLCIWQHGQAKMRRCCTDEWQIIAQTTQKSENVRGKTTSSSRAASSSRCFSRNPKIYTLIISLRCSFWVILCRCNFHFFFSSLFGRVDVVLYFDFEHLFFRQRRPAEDGIASYHYLLLLLLLFDRRWPFLFLQFSREILSVSEKRGLFCPPKIMLQLKLHTTTTSTTTKELKTATAHAHEAQHEESHQKVAFCCAILFFFHCNSDENSPAIWETMNDARVAGLSCAQKSSIFSSSWVFFAEKISSTREESKNLRNSENSIRVTIPCQFMELEIWLLHPHIQLPLQYMSECRLFAAQFPSSITSVQWGGGQVHHINLLRSHFHHRRKIEKEKKVNNKIQHPAGDKCQKHTYKKRQKSTIRQERWLGNCKREKFCVIKQFNVICWTTSTAIICDGFFYSSRTFLPSRPSSIAAHFFLFYSFLPWRHSSFLQLICCGNARGTMLFAITANQERCEQKQQKYFVSHLLIPSQSLVSCSIQSISTIISHTAHSIINFPPCTAVCKTIVDWFFIIFFTHSPLPMRWTRLFFFRILSRNWIDSTKKKLKQHDRAKECETTEIVTFKGLQ